MMQEMERTMRSASPPKKALVPRLLDAERLSESERNALRGAAERKALEGLRLLEQAVRDFAQARRRGDEAALERAVEKLQEGATLWETGSAVQRALSTSGGRPRETALAWFKAQMNIEGAPPSAGGFPWGLTPFHVAMMAMLGLFAAGMFAVYLYKVRRSLALLSRLTARGGDP